MTQAITILGLLAQTSIHAGTGSNTGVIDLPIQREGHNGYPCIFGSSMKGALRTRAEAEANAESVKFVFGPDTNNASDHAGALMVSDARLLLLPIRSLTSQFKWVTCPAVLQRFQRDAERFGMTLDFNVPAVTNTNALVPAQTQDGVLFLEEYRFDAKTDNMDNIIKAIATLMREGAKAELESQLVIVSNDMFAHLCQHATPVNAHIAIESATKTVKGGALWYEETLPPETLLYFGLSAVKSRANDTAMPMPATAILSAVTGMFIAKPWLQVGGNETVGMGWCAVTNMGGK
jgi:CRISPR-associated protein Cmr4